MNILQELAKQYVEIANSEQNKHNIELHKKVNDLKMERPIVLIDEVPWYEMELEDELTCVSEDAEIRQLETELRRTIYKWKHMRADMVVRPYIGVRKIINTTGIGVSRIISENENKDVKAHKFVDQINTIDDLDKIHNEIITYDEKATNLKYEKISNLIGDILPVKICGEPTGYGLGLKTWDDIAQLKSIDNLLYSLIDEPELMHALVQKLTDVFIDKINQYNKLKLFDTDSYYCHSVSALTNDLESNDNQPQSKSTWGRGLAQVLATVSPAMHDEFDISYMTKALEPFGLVYYGCCEPLHQKIDILKKIKNLRKISITPWANYDIAAEAMGKEYVMAAKANPSNVMVDTFDKNAIEKEINTIVQACKKNNCSFEITLKDISSVNNRPQNLFEWEKIVMDIVNQY